MIKLAKKKSKVHLEIEIDSVDVNSFSTRMQRCIWAIISVTSPVLHDNLNTPFLRRSCLLDKGAGREKLPLT